MVDGAHPLVRDPEGGARATSCGPAHDDRRVRAALERLHEVPGVVVVVMGEVDPPHVVGLDEGEDVLEEGDAIGHHAGVDDDRLRRSDHERVHAGRHRAAEGVLVGADEEGVARDLEGLLPETARHDGADAPLLASFAPPAKLSRGATRADDSSRTASQCSTSCSAVATSRRSTQPRFVVMPKRP